MDILVPLQINLGLDDEKKVSVGNISTKVKEMGLEQIVTKAVIEAIDLELVERCCGEKYNRNNSNSEYLRAGTTPRNPVTSVGELNLCLHRINNKRTNKISLALDKYGGIQWTKSLPGRHKYEGCGVSNKIKLQRCITRR